MKEKIIFGSDHSKNSGTTVWRKLFLPNLILILFLGILLFSNVKFTFKENPVLFLVPVILIFQIAIRKLIRFNYKKVYYLEFSNSSLLVKFASGNRQDKITLPIISTDISLIELKDHRSFFEGIQINLLNKNVGAKLRLLDSDWSYETFEKIYLEFKERKSENIPENERRVYEQLQIMNGTKNNAG